MNYYLLCLFDINNFFYLYIVLQPLIVDIHITVHNKLCFKEQMFPVAQNCTTLGTGCGVKVGGTAGLIKAGTHVWYSFKFNRMIQTSTTLTCA